MARGFLQRAQPPRTLKLYLTRSNRLIAFASRVNRTVMNKEKTIFMQQRFIFAHTNMVAFLMFMEIAFTTHVWAKLYASALASVVMYACLHAYTDRAEIKREKLAYQHKSKYHPLRQTEAALCELYHWQVASIHPLRWLAEALQWMFPWMAPVVVKQQACTWEPLVKLKSRAYRVGLLLTLAAMMVVNEEAAHERSEGSPSGFAAGWMAILIIDLLVYSIAAASVWATAEYITNQLLLSCEHLFTQTLSLRETASHVATVRKWLMGAPGLTWRKAGGTRPGYGQQLTNDKLSEALRHQLDFTQAEWDAFGVTGLTADHFVMSGDGKLIVRGVKPGSAIDNEGALRAVLGEHGAIKSVMQDGDGQWLVLFASHASVEAAVAVGIEGASAIFLGEYFQPVFGKSQTLKPWVQGLVIVAMAAFVAALLAKGPPPVDWVPPAARALPPLVDWDTWAAPVAAIVLVGFVCVCGQTLYARASSESKDTTVGPVHVDLESTTDKRDLEQADGALLAA